MLIEAFWFWFWYLLCCCFAVGQLSESITDEDLFVCSVFGFLLFYSYISTVDYDRVIKGETRRGWQLVIPQRLLRKYDEGPIVLHASRYKSLFINDTDPNSWSVILPSIITGGYVVSIDQYSLIKPNSSSTLLKIVTPFSFPILNVCYLSSRIVLIACRQRGSSELHLFLVNITARSSRRFKIKMPDSRNVYFKLAYVSSDPKPRLHLVFAKHTNIPEADRKLEIIDVKYDCTGWDAPHPLLEPLSSESIEIPVGSRLMTEGFFGGGSSVVSMAYDGDDFYDTDKHLCIWFDRQKRCRMNTLTGWLATLQETLEGASIMNAAVAFSHLDPWNCFGVPAVRPFRRLFAVPGRNEVLSTTRSDGILRRLIKTPSMKRLASQSIFHAHPDLKISEVEEATGVKVSDGVRDDGTEEDVKIVHL